MTYAYAVLSDGAWKNPIAYRSEDRASLDALVAKSGRIAGIVVGSEADLSVALSGPAMVGLLNALRPNDPPVTRFATKSDGARRAFAAIEEVAKDAPESPVAETTEEGGAEATVESEEGSEDMAAKKKAKAAKKPRAPKKTGPKALVREDSSRGAILKAGVKGGSTIASIAKSCTNDGDEAKVRLRAKVVAEVVGATVSFDDGKLSIKLPKGVTLDSIFGKA